MVYPSSTVIKAIIGIIYPLGGVLRWEGRNVFTITFPEDPPAESELGGTYEKLNKDIEEILNKTEVTLYE